MNRRRSLHFNVSGRFSLRVAWPPCNITGLLFNSNRLFGPDNIPLLLVGHRGLVEVDYGFHVHISSLKDYECDASPEAWSMLQTWSSRIRHKGTKIAMFSATPQGGGVALMRHAFLRLAKLLDLDIKWYGTSRFPLLRKANRRKRQVRASATIQRVSGDEDEPQYSSRSFHKRRLLFRG